MDNDDKLSGALQENILTMLCFNDEYCSIIRAGVTPKLFDSPPFREIAGHAIDFIDVFGEAIKDHLPDQLEAILQGDDERKASTYKRLLDNLYMARESINAEYVLSQLHKFIRQQNLKSALIRAVEAVEDGRIDAAEIELQKGLTNQAFSFEPGLDLAKSDVVRSLFDSPEEEGFPLGIPELDRLGIMPRRKELFTFMAPRKAGKSWFLTHCVKQALQNKWSAVVISLEMSEKRYAVRILQSFFSISRREAEVKVTRLIQNRGGELQDIIQETVDRPTLSDPDIKSKMSARVNADFNRRPPFRVKEFATGSLDLMGLNAYLDGLERFEKFTPDLICIDYPKLMKLDADNLRTSLGLLVEGIRGVAKTRNAAVVVVHQGNRESEKAKLVTGDMASEDISIVATSDVVLTYSQTPAEKALGLARLFASQVRNEDSKMQVLISQAYAIGQFCLDSLRLDSDYWGLIGSKGEDSKRKRAADRDDA